MQHWSLRYKDLTNCVFTHHTHTHIYHYTNYTHYYTSQNMFNGVYCIWCVCVLLLLEKVWKIHHLCHRLDIKNAFGLILRNWIAHMRELCIDSAPVVFLRECVCVCLCNDWWLLMLSVGECSDMWPSFIRKTRFGVLGHCTHTSHVSSNTHLHSDLQSDSLPAGRLLCIPMNSVKQHYGRILSKAFLLEVPIIVLQRCWILASDWSERCWFIFL